MEAKIVHVSTMPEEDNIRIVGYTREGVFARGMDAFGAWPVATYLRSM